MRPARARGPVSLAWTRTLVVRTALEPIATVRAVRLPAN